MVCLVLLGGTGCGQNRAADSGNKCFAALGEVMAAKVNGLNGGKGSVVLVVGETDNNQTTDLGQTIAAFRKTLDQSVQTRGVETVPMPAMPPPGFEALSAAKLAALLQKYSDAKYLISFVGVPVLTPRQVAQLPSPRPRVVAVVTFNAPTRAMFASQVLCLAAVPVPGNRDAAFGGSAQELFDAQYQLVTQETAGLLPR